MEHDLSQVESPTEMRVDNGSRLVERQLSLNFIGSLGAGVRAR